MQPLPLLDALEENPPTTSTLWRADPASDGITPQTCLVRWPRPEGPEPHSGTVATW
jgi:hypothetical protein